MRHVIAAAIAVLLAGQCAYAGDMDAAAVKKTLSDLLPGKSPDSIRPSPVPGLFEVIYGPQVIYVSEDGRFVMDGDMVDLKKGRNLTEQLRAEARRKLINSLDPDTMIVFAPRHVKHVVTVFTDVDCPYCRKLHSHMAEYNHYGIEIRYLAFPRSGVNTPSYFKAVSVWCAADRRAAITRAKRGVPMPVRHCSNPVKDDLNLAATLGVTGTPTMILEDGTMLSGYMPPKQLSALLDGKKGMKQ